MSAPVFVDTAALSGAMLAARAGVSVTAGADTVKMSPGAALTGRNDTSEHSAIPSAKMRALVAARRRVRTRCPIERASFPEITNSRASYFDSDVEHATAACTSVAARLHVTSALVSCMQLSTIAIAERRCHRRAMCRDVDVRLVADTTEPELDEVIAKSHALLAIEAFTVARRSACTQSQTTEEHPPLHPLCL